MSEEDVEINVEVDDGMTVVIGPDKETSREKEGKTRSHHLNGSLSVRVHIMTSTAAGD
jgi:hypothetical protein